MRKNLIILLTILLLLIFGRAVSAEGGSIAYGDVVEATLEADAVDSWDFYGHKGDSVEIILESDAFDTFVTLKGPHNEIAIDNNYHGLDSNSMISEFVLLEDGNYTIKARSNSLEEFGNYRLSLELLDENIDPIKTATSGDELTGYLSSGYNSEWRYKAIAGEIVDMRVYSDSFDTKLEISNSEGTLLDLNDDGPDGSNSLLAAFTFPDDGLYYISVSGYDLFDYGQYYLMISETLGGKLYMGEILPGQSKSEYLEAGYWHGWDFIINDETYVTFSLESDYFDAFLELYGPDEFLDSDDDGMGGTNAIIRDYLIDVPGTYTIYASGFMSGASGDYVLEYTIGGDAPSERQTGYEGQLDYDSEGAGDLGSGFYDTWQFEGSADGVISITVISDDFDPYIELYGTENELLAKNDDNGTSFNSLIDSFVLPADGTYEIEVMGTEFASEGSYTILVWEIDMSDTTGVELAVEKEGISPIFQIVGAGLLVLLVVGGVLAFFLVKLLRSK